MTKQQIAKTAILHALATVLYITLVVTLMTNVGEWVEHTATPEFLAPVLFLSLLVFSVAMVGTLIFARPVTWYLDGRKAEAWHLVIYTLASLFVLILIVFLVLVL